jgi:hypothetical protein
MRRSAKTVGISVLALLATGAVIASSASALVIEKATLRTAKGVVAKEAEVKATSTNLVITNTAGKTECGEVAFTGTLTKNEEKTDQLSFPTVTWTGKEAEGACKSTNTRGAVKVTVGHTPWLMNIADHGTGGIKAVKPPEIHEEFVTSKKNASTSRLIRNSNSKSANPGHQKRSRRR